MFDALYIGATGMQAQQLNVDTIANNLANVNTAAFKRGHVSFADLMVRDARPPSAGTGIEGFSNLLAAAPRLGSGVGISSVSKQFELGELKQTNSSYDVAIQGDGFIELLMADGGRAYTRGGSFIVNKDGLLATQDGHALKPEIAIPSGMQDLIIHPDGRVQGRTPNDDALSDLGQIELIRFTNVRGLMALGSGTYAMTNASGEGISAKAGEDGMGRIAQGYLEGSNVKMVDEMVNLMIAQRTYEASVKVVQAADEMLGMINGLRR